MSQSLTLMQYLITAVILLMAFGYAAWRIYKSLHSSGNPCDGCAGCALKQQQLKARQTKKRPPCYNKEAAV
ncbi:MAG: FeoB-associated Cys-rich membrane protein [Prevotella sp.]|nr:FeoB-associated Cys-rich membrane protein [Prevotella sp.]